jgi:phospholipid/cholesterol/gamma-HCH transport system substrate-binding protein
MKLNNETKIGILVVAVLLILFGLTVKSGNFDFSAKGYEIKAQFHTIDGVKLNAPVTLNGFEVGRVKDIKIAYGNPTVMELTLWLDEIAKVHAGAQASIRNMGFMGEKYIGLTTGDDTTEFLSAGAVITGKDPASMDNILNDGEVIAKNLKEISMNINERLTVNKHLVDDTMVHVNSASLNLDEMSADLKSNPWKLLYRPKREHNNSPDTK